MTSPHMQNGASPMLPPTRLRSAVTGPTPAPVSPSEEGLDAAELYLNRELTWLEFNRRILAEAEAEHNPLLERVKFLAITGSNLDEFFMKRIGGLKLQAAAGVPQPSIDGRTPQQQLAECYAWVRDFDVDRRRVERELLALLAEHGIRILEWQQLSSAQRSAARSYYLKNVFPLVTPLALDPAHPFPFVSNLSLNLLVTGQAKDHSEPVVARVKVPVGPEIPRLLHVEGQGHLFVRLEDVMAHTLDVLFPGLDIISCESFRVTRNANTERDEEEADDLLELIESELRDRRFAPIVRLEIGSTMDPTHRGMLASELHLNDPEDVFEKFGMLAQRDLMELVGIDEPGLHDPPFHPLESPRLPAERNIFHSIRDAQSLLVFHPYESFAGSVERFLREASQDPKVQAIKMTLYRTSHDARVVGYLEDAARNGKQVAVVVELKARFDEAANIAFAEQLEGAGIHVSYGVLGLKTHCKVIMVVRQDYDGLRRYIHIGTGNYHPETARIYADLGLFTIDEQIARDATELFNFLTTGYGAKRSYHKLLPAPTRLKPALLERIERERLRGTDGRIQFKMNALEDADITQALYRAARAGVRIDLVIRDTCRLRPGLEGISETVRVVSIVGRFLEHARVYYFRNGGAEEYFIGSADAMQRNLESRVETLAPVEDTLQRKALRAMLDMQLAPNRNGWVMDSQGMYTRTVAGDADRGCQQALYEWLAGRDATPVPAPTRLRRARSFARRAQSRLAGEPIARIPR